MHKSVCVSKQELYAAILAARKIIRSDADLAEPAENEVFRWLYQNAKLVFGEYSAAAQDLKSAEPTIRKISSVYLTKTISFVIKNNGQLNESSIEDFLRGTVFGETVLSLIPALCKMALIRVLLSSVSENNLRRTSACIESLRTLKSADLSDALDNASAIEQIYKQDPAGVYPKMDRDARRDYRFETVKLARKYNLSETECAYSILNLSRKSQPGSSGNHIGEYIFKKPLGKLCKPRTGRIYIAAYIVLHIAAFFAFALYFGVLQAILAALPITVIIMYIINKSFSAFCSGRRLFRMDFEKGIPVSVRTVCALSVLVTSEDKAHTVALRLEECCAITQDCGSNLEYALICDLKEAKSETLEADELIKKALEREIKRLSSIYNRKFTLFLRKRVYYPSDKIWRGYERKRGAIEDFISALIESDTDTKYLITLDEDTILTPGAALHMIEAMSHPLNRDFGIISPKLMTTLAASGRNLFTLIKSGGGGYSPYGGVNGDIYSAVSGAGSFYGKGIIRITAYREKISGKMPVNLILSHDVLETAHLRCGNLSEVELGEGFPESAAAYYARQDRWIRGDMQNIVFLFKRYIPIIERFKIYDNIRRALLPMMQLVSIISAACGAGFLPCAVLALAQVLLPRLLAALRAIKLRGIRKYSSRIPDSPSVFALGALYNLILLPAEAYVSAGAVIKAIYRLITKKHRLVWTTAAEARPNRMSKKQTMADTAQLINYARDIWAYFEENLNKEYNYLIPDNIESDANKTAYRTSPTNIGFSLLAVICAEDFGFIGSGMAKDLISGIISTIERLDKWNGHLLNWYDIKEAKPLYPRTVSSVDSGNFAACLITAAQAALSFSEPDLYHRINNILSAMDFGALFDRKKSLFRIGYDVDTGTFSSGYYDLIASEALILSYTASALNAVPAKHFKKLGREQTLYKGYGPCLSWSGSAFEYLMPFIFFNAPSGSLLYESAMSAVIIQRSYKTRKPGKKQLWGVSESLTDTKNECNDYAYSARGIPELSLDNRSYEQIFAPYASCLALEFGSEAAMENLSNMRSLGMYGRYGFYDAYNAQSGKPARAHMAHHLGMSIAAISNAVNGTIRKAYMRDIRMKAHLSLLELRFIRGVKPVKRTRFAALFDERSHVIHTVKPQSYKEKKSQAVFTFGRFDDACPPCTVVNNTARDYTAVVSASGQVSLRCRDISLWRCEFGNRSIRADRKSGLVFFAKINNELIPLQPMPEFNLSQYSYIIRFFDNGCRFDTISDELQASVEMTISETGGFVYTVKIAGARCELISGAGCELIAFAEPVLTRERDYNSHPAFNKLLFECDSSGNTLTMKRRSRTGLPNYLSAAFSKETEFCTSRENSIGRRGLSALSEDFNYRIMKYSPEPCFISKTVLHSGECINIAIAFSTESGDEAKKRSQSLIEANCSRSRVIGNGNAIEILSYILYGNPYGNIPKNLREVIKLGREALWASGISGDYPIVCHDLDDKSSDCAKAVAEHEYLADKQIRYDLVFLTGEGGDDYFAPHRRKAIRETKRYGASINSKSGIYIQEKESPTAKLCLALSVGQHERPVPGTERQVASMPGTEQTSLPGTERQESSVSVPGTEEASVSVPVPGTGQASLSGTGLQTEPVPGTGWQVSAPVAWCQVCANPRFGAILSDDGIRHAWHRNARQNMLIPWRNDPSEPPSAARVSALYKGKLVSLFGDEFIYSFGFARYKTCVEGCLINTAVFVPPDTDALVFSIEAEDEVQIVFCADLEISDGTGGFNTIESWFTDNTLFFRNAFNRDYISEYALSSDVRIAGYTANRISANRGQFDGKTGCGFPACAAIITAKSKSIVIAFGTAVSAAEAVKEGVTKTLMSETRNYWDKITKNANFRSGYEKIDRYMNGMAVYQTLACRLYARASIYQCGGAFGYRDQLQDAAALADIMPELLREQILKSSAMQFPEGDAAHWWHETDRNMRGVRTRITDDLLFLPFAVSRYIAETGDISLLDKEVTFLFSHPLSPDENERYEILERSDETASVYEHCIRAIRLVQKRGVGANGLLKIGTGDWNDGMSSIGDKGYGESTWLTWFASAVADDFACTAERSGLQERTADAAWLRTFASGCRTAGNNAFRGDRFIRGTYDDGTEFGAKGDPECAIDSVAQSFAVFAGADREKARIAVNTAYDLLFDHETGIVKLLAPPFDGIKNPGYIKAYAPGFRENGGQYTHAAIWLALALHRIGETEKAKTIMAHLAPRAAPGSAHLAPGSADADRYKAEPYVLAADIYSEGENAGRAGWTWYTGAAGWYYSAAQEIFCGKRIKSFSGSPPLPN